MDIEYNSKIRPSFSEIISQMTPLDAKNLKLLRVYHGEAAPICQYRFMNVDGTRKLVQTNVFLSNPKVKEIDIQASSMTELSHLGLISITFEEFLVKPNAYDIFKTHPFYATMKKAVPSVPEDGYKKPRDNKLIKKADIARGIVRLTPLGYDFLDVCLVD